MISFTEVEIKFGLTNKLKVRGWIKDIILSEMKTIGGITYVFCNDNYLVEMNVKYLNHNTLTDIITFDYSESNKISGDIFISIERVRENAIIFNTSFNAEIGRVMAHGVLHLLGYKDKSGEDKKVMRSKEDLYLSMYPNL
jgi:rRNA maturation RNase YbeY